MESEWEVVSRKKPAKAPVLEEPAFYCVSCHRTLDCLSFSATQLKKAAQERCKECASAKLPDSIVCASCSRYCERSSFTETQLKKKWDSQNCKACLSTMLQCHFCSQSKPLTQFSFSQKSKAKASSKCKMCVIVFSASSLNDLTGARASCKIAKVYYLGNALHPPDQLQLLFLQRAARVKDSPAATTAEELGIELATAEQLGIGLAALEQSDDEKAERICLFHRQGWCKYGTLCKNLHHLDGLDDRQVQSEGNSVIADDSEGKRALEGQESASILCDRPEGKSANAAVANSGDRDGDPHGDHGSAGNLSPQDMEQPGFVEGFP
eukprot:g4636.t1